MLARHVRVFKEDRTLAVTFQHAVGDLRIAAHRAALVALHPVLSLRPATAPGQLVEALAGGAGADPVAEPRQQVEVFVGEGQHRRLHRIVGDQRQGLLREGMQVVGARVGGQPGVYALHFHPIARGGHGGDEGLAVDYALALERGRLGEDRGRVDRVHQVDRPVQGALGRAHADHFGDQFHQAALAAIGVALQRREIGQEAQPLDGIEGAPDRVQFHPQLTQATIAGAQPAEQGGVLVVVVQAVGGQADAHGNHPVRGNGILCRFSPCERATKITGLHTFSYLLHGSAAGHNRQWGPSVNQEVLP
ncbi:hypothetical protein D3C71_1232410 [compost metagenome]